MKRNATIFKTGVEPVFFIAQNLKSVLHRQHNTAQHVCGKI